MGIADLDVGLVIDPLSHHFLQDQLFDDAGNETAGDRIQRPYADLRDWFGARGIPVHTADRFESGIDVRATNVYVSMGLRDRWPRLAGRPDVAFAAFFALECPIVEPRLYRTLDVVDEHFPEVYSFSDSESLRPFLPRPVAVRPFRIPQSYDHVHAGLWDNDERDFLTMINANKRPRLNDGELYSERLRAIAHFERHGEIDLYGVNWDGPPYRVGASWVPPMLQRARRGLEGVRQRLVPDPLLAAAARAYRGPVRSKSETLASYTFAICFENMVLSGWITEKIFDCLFAGTIPVYLGDPAIEAVVPPDAFVDMRRFDGYDDLRSYLRGLSTAERQQMREAGREFVESEAFQPFTSQAFTDLFAGIVARAAGIPTHALRD